MFDSVVLKGDSETGFIDVGVLAECLIFYKKVHLLLSRPALKGILNVVPPYVFLSLLEEGRVVVHFVSDFIGVSSNGNPLDLKYALVTFNSPGMRIDYDLKMEFVKAAGSSSQAKLGGSKFLKMLRSIDHGEFSQEKIMDVLEQEAQIQDAISAIIYTEFPDYNRDKPIRFKIIRAQSDFQIETNIDFEWARIRNPRVTPAYLVGRLQSVYEDLYFSGLLDSEIQADRTAQHIQEVSIQSMFRRRFESENNIVKFSDLTLGSSLAIRDAINSGRLPFAELMPTLKRSDKFKGWLEGVEPEANMLNEFYLATVEKKLFDRLPTKISRWAVFTGLGVITDLCGGGGLGTAAGIGMGAFDSFLFDRVVSGWRPHQFIEDELRPALKIR